MSGLSKSVYLDNNATTFLKEEVFEAMKPYYNNVHCNASSKFYKIGRDAEQELYKLRESVAKSIGAANVNEVYFTGSGCEADNWAIKGIAFANRGKGNHIITTKIEHHAVLGTCEWLEKQGFEVTYLPVDEKGYVSAEAVRNAVREYTILVSIILINNEIGTIQNAEEIGRAIKEKNSSTLFHIDAVQAFGKYKIDVKKFKCDMLSASAHKFNGPKCVGFFYIKNRGKGKFAEKFIPRVRKNAEN